VLAAAELAHRYVERPGIRVGKRVAARYGARAIGIA
jgi:peptidoglycan/LPS O-acetylase OafA/YrhL